MANNEHINKVVKSTGETLIDLTNDTVTAGTLLKDVTAHDRSGAQITGAVVIPTVNDGTLTIQQNGITKATFTANQAGNVTANIESGDAYGIDMYDDTLPIDITARGDNLEDWVIYGNDLGVGQKSKNLLELAAETQTINGITFTIDKLTGTVIANGTATGLALLPLSETNIYDGIEYDVSPMVISGCPQDGSYDTYLIQLFDSTTRSYTSVQNIGEPVEFTNETSHKYNLIIVIRSGQICNNLVFKPMIRASNTTSSFIPYGYELPIITKQTGKADITTNIYLGTSPLTEGQSLSKTQATTKDIPTYNGECTIDTTYPNKPRMEIIPTDSAINIINKLKGCMPLSGGTMTGDILFNVSSAAKALKTTSGNVEIEFDSSALHLSAADVSGQAAQRLADILLEYDIEADISALLMGADEVFISAANWETLINLNENGISLTLPTNYATTSNLYINNMKSGSGSEIVIGANGDVYKSSSSRDIKHDIQYIDNTNTYHNALMQIKPATYVYNNDKTETAKLGMIAEDIADVMPIAALTGEGGKVENYDTRAIIAMLVMEVQRLNAEIERLRGDSNAD